MEHNSRSETALAKVGNPWLRSYLYYVTLLGVFANLLISHAGQGLKYMEVNLFLLCLLVKIRRVPKWTLWFLLYLALSGALGIARGTDAFSGFFVELRAIAVNVFYYYFFFKLIRNDFERAFFTYTKIAYWFAIIAFPIWIWTCISAHGYVRLTGLATEPAEFCSIVLPAYYWFAYQFTTYRKHGREVFVFSLAVILSASSVGYISVAFGILLLLSGRGRRLLIAPVVICALLGVAYAVSSDVRMRVTDTFIAATTADLSGANSSTFSLITNAVVAGRVLQEHPLMGNGLGSHPVSHERFKSDLGIPEAFYEYHWDNINALEAGSLTIRVLSELGILGFLGVLAFLIHFHVGGGGQRTAISNAILACFFHKLIHAGAYYPPEQFFFIFIYILNYREFKRETRIRAPYAPPTLSLEPLNRADGLAVRRLTT